MPSARYKKKERKRETKEGDRWRRRQGTYAPVLWGDEVWIFGLDFRINLSRARHEMSDSCHRKEGWRMWGGGEGEDVEWVEIRAAYIPQRGWRRDTVWHREAETCRATGNKVAKGGGLVKKKSCNRLHRRQG